MDTHIVRLTCAGWGVGTHAPCLRNTKFDITERQSGTVLWLSAATLLSLHLQAPMSTQSKPVFANFSVYKGKAALSLKIRKPRWSEMNDGGYMLHRPGSLILELAPVSPESANSMGSRTYVWDRKQSFALSPVEIGGFIEAVADKRPMKELFHDPNMGRPGDNGKISKTLSLQPFGEKGDWYLGLEVKDANNKENSVKLGVPLTGGELHTIKALSEFLIPRLIGWDEVLNVVDL